MEPYFNSIEEEREYLERRARRKKRMMLERKRRRRRRLIIQMALGLVVILTVIFTVVGAVSKKVKADKAETAEKNQEAVTEQAEIYTEPIEEELEEKPEPVVPETIAYEFVSTENTKNIYSENVISSHAILVDESTDTIIASKGAKERINPASMTKVLTVLVAAEHITEEQLEDTFTMTIDITDYSYVNDCSNVGFLVDEKVKIKDLFYGTILPSGGDAAVGLATYVAGSHETFVELMNQKLEALGLADTAHFTNCVGLYDSNHYCTLYDMAVIMKAA